MLQGPDLNEQPKHFEKPWASTAIMFVAMALCLPAAALVRRLRSLLRRMDAAAAGSELREPLLAQRSGGSTPSSAASSTVFGWATPSALQAPAAGPPGRTALLLVLVPTGFDLACSWLLNVGLLSITASGALRVPHADVRGAAPWWCWVPPCGAHTPRPPATAVYMMLRGSEVLFAALLSRLWLGRLLNRWHLAGLGTCTVSRPALQVWEGKTLGI